MSNERDCPHGRQVGKCSDCDLAELYDVATELDMAKATIRRLEKENEQLRQQNTSLDAECPRLEVLNAELVEALASFTKSEYIKRQHPRRYANALAALAKVEAKC